MSIHSFLDRFARDESGLAAEFALVLPLFLLLLLGTIDVGIYSWRINQLEKATQAGARYAAVTDPVTSGLDVSFVNQTIGGTQIQQGDRLPQLDFYVRCDSTGCDPCQGTDCGTLGPIAFQSIAFGNLADRMRAYYPGVQDANIRVEYRGSGLGYAGDPNGPDAAPLITVRLVNLQYTPVTLSPIGTSVDLPDFAYSITAEDANGSRSN
ncbi:TadE/TadG family type IV pilus assembly protein [Altererythrobacter ishigakiensis]|uniref:TadE-like protein n=1 Tax=Altererythrobacter ishigakiensis TaxID=476157 RepID=A0A562UN60_9SPHN|nr:TadE/TadG family type IV pilus assembly protein [Altererythrobacter ishigakiensis]TWJ07065.1 TadE-like protein [Altererythrobacter ishigakiensis]